jgi:hypothetical protein
MSHDKNIMNIAISGQMYHGTFPCNLMVKIVMNKRTQTCSIDRRTSLSTIFKCVFCNLYTDFHSRD